MCREKHKIVFYHKQDQKGKCCLDIILDKKPLNCYIKFSLQPL